MPSGGGAFFRIVRTPVVRNGGDTHVNADGEPIARVGLMREMIVQICAHYTALPDVRTMADGEIRFFYEGIRAALKRETKPGK